MALVADVAHRGLLVLHREKAEVHLGDAQVRAHPHGRHGDEAPGQQVARFPLEDPRDLPLQQAVHLVLSEAVHRAAKVGGRGAGRLLLVARPAFTIDHHRSTTDNGPPATPSTRYLRRGPWAPSSASSASARPTGTTRCSTRCSTCWARCSI